MPGKVPDQKFFLAQWEAVPVRKGTIERRRGAAHGPERGFLLRVIKNGRARLGLENLGIVRVIKMPVGEKDVADFRLGKGELQGGGGAAGIDEGSLSLIQNQVAIGEKRPHHEAPNLHHSLPTVRAQVRTATSPKPAS